MESPDIAPLIELLVGLNTAIGELAISNRAQIIALGALVPGFESHYKRYLTDPNLVALKHEYEQKNRQLLEIGARLSGR